jgi:hypothetical protein
VRIFVAGMLCLHLLFFFSSRERIQRGYPDFTVFYTAATMLREGQGRSLYDERAQFRVQAEFAGDIESRLGPLPYIHPPFEALIFLPLTLFRYRYAFVTWDLLNGAALFAVALVLRRHLKALGTIPPWEFVLAFLAFFPVFVSLLQGQDSILMLLLCALAFNALERDSDYLAGGWFALAAFKFQIVVPLVLLVVLWKRKRVGVGFVSGSFVLALVSLALVGWKGVLAYPAFAVRMGTEPSLGAVPAALMPNLRGLVEGWSLGLAHGVLQGLVISGSIALLMFAVWNRGTPEEGQFNLQFSLGVVVAVLVGWHTNAHDLSVLILPLVLVADYCWSARIAGRRRSALILPVLPILISPLWILLWLEYGKVNLMTIPLLWWVWSIGSEISHATQYAPELEA